MLSHLFPMAITLVWHIEPIARILPCLAIYWAAAPNKLTDTTRLLDCAGIHTGVAALCTRTVWTGLALKPRDASSSTIDSFSGDYNQTKWLSRTRSCVEDHGMSETRPSLPCRWQYKLNPNANLWQSIALLVWCTSHAICSAYHAICSAYHAPN